MKENVNRINQPDLQLIDKLDIANFKSEILDNGVPVYIVGGIEEDIIKIELRFKCGRWHEPAKNISRATCNLMRKGTLSKTSKQIADAIEFYGASVETQNGEDYTSFIIFTLGKYIHEILPLAKEILLEPSFPENELELFKQKQKQKLRINEQNTDFHANRKMGAVLWGENHPYGYAMQEADLDAIDSNQLLNFHRKYYEVASSTLFISGNIKNETLKIINTYFGNDKSVSAHISNTDKSVYTDYANQFFIEKNDSVQSSIRIVDFTIPKTHADYPGLNVLNTVFGGYFGSRLMSNIREDKGYTYGIYSSITHYNHGSFFSISTEVGNEVCANALKEIYNEMHTLQNTLIANEELTIVRNYMMGSILRATDGPFNRINVLKNLVMSGLDIHYFDSLVEGIKTTTPQKILELANMYFKLPMKEIICGKKEI